MHAALYSTHSSSLGFFGSMLKEIALRWRRWLMEENEKRESEVLQGNSEWPCKVVKKRKSFHVTSMLSVRFFGLCSG